MLRIEFTVEGNPHGKERPRFTKCGICYTPKTTTAYEKKVRDAYIAAGGEMIDNPVRIRIEAFYRIPKSVKKADIQLMECGVTLPTKKPDIDNIIKIVCDGLNGVAYSDDAQVCIVYAEKRYSHEPQVRVVVQELIL